MFTGHDGPAAKNVYWFVIDLADKWEVLSLINEITNAGQYNKQSHTHHNSLPTLLNLPGTSY